MALFRVYGSPYQGATRGKAIPETRNGANLGMGLNIYSLQSIVGQLSKVYLSHSSKSSQCVLLLGKWNECKNHCSLPVPITVQVRIFNFEDVASVFLHHSLCLLISHISQRNVLHRCHSYQDSRWTLLSHCVWLGSLECPLLLPSWS